MSFRFVHSCIGENIYLLLSNILFHDLQLFLKVFYLLKLDLINCFRVILHMHAEGEGIEMCLTWILYRLELWVCYKNLKERIHQKLNLYKWKLQLFIKVKIGGKVGYEWLGAFWFSLNSTRAMHVVFSFQHLTFDPSSNHPCPEGSNTKSGYLCTMSAKFSQVASPTLPLVHCINPNTTNLLFCLTIFLSNSFKGQTFIITLRKLTHSSRLRMAWLQLREMKIRIDFSITWQL